MRKYIIICFGCGIILIASLIIGISMFSSTNRRISKQLDLGNRYLLEENYEQAIAAFNNVIAIDPVNAEAYICLSDAYLGMGDYDNAESILKKGIESITNAINSGSSANRLDDNLILLNEKLAEVEEEIARILEEKNVGEEKTQVNDEKEKIDNIPRISIQPLLDQLDDIWGKNWKDWTSEDYIASFGLTDFYGHNNWYDKEQYDNERVRSANIGNDGFVCMSDGFDMKIGDKYCRFIDESIFINSDSRIFLQSITSTTHEVPADGIYPFCIANGITDGVGAIRYFGLDMFVDGNTANNSIEVMTEYGKATVHIANIIGGTKELHISEFEKDEQMNISFSDSKEGEDISFKVRIEMTD